MEEPKFCSGCRWYEIDGLEEPCVRCNHNGGALDLWENQNKAVETVETVEHPDHYKTGKFECIDVMVEIYGAEATKDFCLLNAFKYLWRCKHKGKEIEDIKKAKFYLEKYLEL